MRKPTRYECHACDGWHGGPCYIGSAVDYCLVFGRFDHVAKNHCPWRGCADADWKLVKEQPDSSFSEAWRDVAVRLKAELDEAIYQNNKSVASAYAEVEELRRALDHERMKLEAIKELIE